MRRRETSGLAPGRSGWPLPGDGRPGVAAVELAVLAPLLVALVLGSVELARGIMARDVLSDAVRQSCRLAVQPGSTTASVTADASAILTGNGISTANASCTVLVNGTETEVGAAKAGDRVTVRLSIPYADVSWLPAAFLPGDIRSELTMMRQR